MIAVKYTWGLDLSGVAGNSTTAGIHGAGGIGGLLAVQETATTGSPSYWFLYDADGNVGQAIKASDQTIAAHYEYDPYGNAIVSTGTYAAANPFRFSTKWFNPETGLYYYGYRYYSPRLGRWISGDPMGEAGSFMLVLFGSNSPTIAYDALGLWDETMHRAGTLAAALAVNMHRECAQIVSNWDQGVDDWTPAWLFPQYHFDLNIDDLPFAGGRNRTWYADHRWNEGRDALEQARSFAAVERGLQRIGQSLHSIQDGLSHTGGGQASQIDGRGHLAQSAFWHAPSWICLLRPFDARCAQARNSPNWQDPHRPDSRDHFPQDFQNTWDVTRARLAGLMQIHAMHCYCTN